MSLLSPIQVVALRFDEAAGSGKAALTLGLSHQVKNFGLLRVSLVDRQGNPVPVETRSAVASRRDLSSSWQVVFDAGFVSSDKNSFTLSIGCAAEGLSAETSEGHSLFRDFLVHVDVDRNVETDKLHPRFELAER